MTRGRKFFAHISLALALALVAAVTFAVDRPAVASSAPTQQLASDK